MSDSVTAPRGQRRSVEMHGEQHEPAYPRVVHEGRDEQAVVPYDENLLERSRTQWQFGDWESLTRINHDMLQHHPDRAKIALLAGAGHLQTSNVGAGLKWVRLAQEWGCSRQLVRRILVAGVYNSLGRAAAAAGEAPRAHKHFRDAVAIGMPESEVRLLATSRIKEQLTQIEAVCSTETQALGEKTAEHNGIPGRQNSSEGATTSLFAPDAYEFYKKISAAPRNGVSSCFVLLDSKSLPRSGLHYLKNSLARLLRSQFSFCEWYQEPGCCKKMPCAITGYAEQCQKTNKSRIRLTKSHDFNLTDPDYPPLFSARRVVLVRNPLFLLTSWFALDQLTSYRKELDSRGIKLQKLWLAHEPELLGPAYEIMDQAFVAPTMKSLDEWLHAKCGYITGFMRKWVKPAYESRVPFWTVVRYEEIDDFIESLLGELREYLSVAEPSGIAQPGKRRKKDFHAREDAFRVQSRRMSEYLKENADTFVAASRALSVADESRLFQRYSLE